MPLFTTPNSFGSPLREFNPCHNPGGAETGGQFCSRKSEPFPTGITMRRDFDFAALGSRKFMMHARTGEVIFGPRDRQGFNTHAEFLDAMDDTGGSNYDDWVRGNIQQDGDRQEISIYNKYGEFLPGGKDDARAALFDASAKVVQRFIASGAGKGVRYEQQSDWTRSTLGERFPGFFKPVRRRRRVREVNTCHVPSGSPAGGQFCSTAGRRSGSPKITETNDGYQRTLTMTAADGSEIGAAKFRMPYNRQSSGVAELDILYIDRAARGQGHAERLYRAVATRLRALGATHVVGDVTSAGILRLGIKVLGKPDMVVDAVDKFTVAQAMKQLESLSPENAEGVIDTANYLSVRWPLRKRKY